MLVWARLSFGLIIAWEVLRYIRHDRISRYYIEPDFTFTYYGFEWVQPFSALGMGVLFAVIVVSALGVAAGALYRVCAPLLFVSFSYFFLLDAAQYLNHIYLCCWLSLLLCFMPANRCFAVDTRLGLAPCSDVVPAWTLWLLRAQVGLVYFWGGVAKLNGDWLNGLPMLGWMEGRREMWLIGPLLAWDPTAYLMSCAGLALDLLMFPLLIWRRTRLWALGAAVLFHLLNLTIFNIGIFPFLMVAWTLLFLDAGAPRRLFRQRAVVVPSVGPLLSRLGAVLLGGWLFIQLALPLRHWLYPGNVSWTEEGHRFAWHMKLRSKSARATFVVRDVDTGRQWKVEPSDLLTDRQRRKMITRPDLIVQFAHHIEDELRARGHREVEVRAHVFASLNGRRRQRLVKETVDLTQVELRLWPPADWIVPLSEPRQSGWSVIQANSGGQ